MTVMDPQMGADYPLNDAEFSSRFRDEAACLEFLATVRWPRGFQCTRCQSSHAWQTAEGLLLCRQCAYRTSVTAGTIFDRTKSPLPKWLRAAWLMTRPEGVSALELFRELPLGSYKTAWSWLHKLRRATALADPHPFDGEQTIKEIDIHLLSGVPRRNHQSSSGHIPVMIAIEHDDDTRPRVQLAIAYQAETVALQGFATKTITEGSTVHVYSEEIAEQLRHLGYVAALAENDRPQGETFMAHMKCELEQWSASALRQAVSVDHLPYYLDEFAFRFNHRGRANHGLAFYHLIQQALTTSPWPLSDLTNP